VSVLPIDRPGKIIAVGLNYRDHASEATVTPPKSPILFAKWTTCLVGPDEPIVIPTGIDEVDWEAELAVIIGRTAQDVHIDDALDFVRGYTCMNDVSARRAQRDDGQWTRAKSFDTFGPIGPKVVPAREIPDPQSLNIRARVNGQIMQDSNTSEMIFSVAHLIAFISAGVTLEPGDVITTGTPNGVGAFRPTPIFLQPGDRVDVEIDGIGTLSNPVTAA
jgi:2,4-didehydro-3-deoxy-L-rhamnonate hydrolase